MEGVTLFIGSLGYLSQNMGAEIDVLDVSRQ